MEKYKEIAIQIITILAYFVIGICAYIGMWTIGLLYIGSVNPQFKMELLQALAAAKW